LWGRLSQGNLVINIPPLDAHWWDIPEYVDGLLERFGTGVCISDQSLEILTACAWKNNYRSLGCLNENGVALGLLGEISGSAPGSIVTPDVLLSVIGSEADTQRELRRAIETLGILLPPPDKQDAIFPDGMDAWFARADSRRWEFVLDIVFNRLRGPQNENFLLASRDAKRLGISTDELALALGLAGREAVLKSLKESGVLSLPEGVREKELSDSVARRYRRQLILFAKRTQFIGLSHEELAEVSGANRTKYYNFYRYAFKLAEGMYASGGMTPPMSRYVIDHRGEAERSDRRPVFANESFEKKAGQMTESFAGLRKLSLMPGRGRSG